MKKPANSPITIRDPARHGWVPDIPDQRDFLYRSYHRPKRKLPAQADLRPFCSPVEQQGRLGSCTAHALVSLLEYLDRKRDADSAHTDLSRLFVYYNARAIRKDTLVDKGAMLRDGIKSLAKQGVCPETLWPYDEKQVFEKPSTGCYTQAKRHLIGSYQRLTTLDEMRACLADGFPFAFGFSIYESFERDNVAKTGTVNLPAKDEHLLNAHAVCAVGYDDAEQRFIVRNSWGAGWGRKGHFTMPYAYLEDRQLSNDFWTIRQFAAPTEPAKTTRRRK